VAVGQVGLQSAFPREMKLWVMDVDQFLAFAKMWDYLLVAMATKQTESR
jgi:hypothetical protein